MLAALLNVCTMSHKRSLYRRYQFGPESYDRGSRANVATPAIVCFVKMVDKYTLLLACSFAVTIRGSRIRSKLSRERPWTKIPMSFTSRWWRRDWRWVRGHLHRCTSLTPNGNGAALRRYYTANLYQLPTWLPSVGNQGQRACNSNKNKIGPVIRTGAFFSPSCVM